MDIFELSCVHEDWERLNAFDPLKQHQHSGYRIDVAAFLVKLVNLFYVNALA
jgi:hypothetical protein